MALPRTEGWPARLVSSNFSPSAGAATWSVTGALLSQAINPDTTQGGCLFGDAMVLWGPSPGPVIGADADELTASEIKARLAVYDDLAEKKRRNPDLGNARVADTGTLLGIRQTCFFEGEYKITAMARTAQPGTHLIVDVNGNYSVAKAIEAVHFFHGHGVVLFEEPCPYWRIEETKAVREACAAIGLPVAGDEYDYVDTMWERMIDQRVMDVCQPDLLYIGGFSPLRIARYAARHGLQVTPHFQPVADLRHGLALYGLYQYALSLYGVRNRKRFMGYR